MYMHLARIVISRIPSTHITGSAYFVYVSCAAGVLVSGLCTTGLAEFLGSSGALGSPFGPATAVADTGGPLALASAGGPLGGVTIG